MESNKCYTEYYTDRDVIVPSSVVNVIATSSSIFLTEGTTIAVSMGDVITPDAILNLHISFKI